MIQVCLEASDDEINRIYSEAIKEGYNYDANLYKATGTEFIPFEKNEALQQQIRAIEKQTKGTFKNITQTTGFIKEEGRSQKV